MPEFTFPQGAMPLLWCSAEKPVVLIPAAAELCGFAPGVRDKAQKGNLVAQLMCTETSQQSSETTH